MLTKHTRMLPIELAHHHLLQLVRTKPGLVLFI